MRALDPFAHFADWFAQAQASEPNDPEAFTLATVDSNGQPSARMLLMKEHGPAGFVFVTNSHSRKGLDLAGNPRAAMLFHWKSLRRQVRITGLATLAAEEEAERWFAPRTRLSQLAAWASRQSEPLASRAELEARLAEAQKRFEGEVVPRPPYWHAYRILPETFEFWSDGEGRLHHRSLFSAEGADRWREALLNP